MVDIAVVDLPSNPLATLQEHASQLKYRQLLRILWSDAVDPDGAGDLFPALGAFHAWLPDNTLDDYGYVLHFDPTAAQQGRLHRSLRDQTAAATIWRAGQLLLIGAIRQPLSREIADLVAVAPNLSADEIAERLADRSDSHTVRNELTRLARQRVIARRKQLPRLPEFRIPKTRRARNVFHYWPLWQAESAFAASPSEVSQEGQKRSKIHTKAASGSLEAPQSGQRTVGL